ncbi:hypothetical protein G3I40_12325 [Streptomyces sp. SID14478]|uniref:hypothetical protein n=1 Tax=Streptomyces sp. SID14478 TaxID=2706073 RepID=UPI0013D9090C|nr:hypothetical protein [Streptomyces sp. SID14478]NEB76001.1 hypothetical protein [Streptomyces sp. SID14478]
MPSFMFVYGWGPDDDVAGLTVFVTASDPESADLAAREDADAHARLMGAEGAEEWGAYALPPGQLPRTLGALHTVHEITADPFPVGTRLKDARGNLCRVTAQRAEGLFLTVTGVADPSIGYTLDVPYLRQLLNGPTPWATAPAEDI